MTVRSTLLAIGEREHTFGICHVQGVQASDGTHAWITWGADDRVGLLVLGKPPGDGVFAAAASDDEDFHDDSGGEGRFQGSCGSGVPGFWVGAKEGVRPDVGLMTILLTLLEFCV